MESVFFLPAFIMSFFVGINAAFVPVVPPTPHDFSAMEAPMEAFLEEAYEKPLDLEVVPETGIDYRPLAECLTEQGWVMYGADWCPHCQSQKASFGSAFEAIKYVECEQQAQQCQDAGITGYPTWKKGEVEYSGNKSVWELAELSGCSW